MYSLANSQLSKGSKLKETEETDDALKLVYTCTDAPLDVTVIIEKTKTASVARVKTSVTNTGDAPVTITALTSAFVQGIAHSRWRKKYFDTKDESFLKGLEH